MGGDGLSRRDLLKRGTLAGLVWATPAVQGIAMVRSSAQATSGDGCPIEVTFVYGGCSSGLRIGVCIAAEWTATNTGVETLYVRWMISGDCTDPSYPPAWAIEAISPGETISLRQAVSNICTLTLEVEVLRCPAGWSPESAVASCQVLCTVRDSETTSVEEL